MKGITITPTIEDRADIARQNAAITGQPSTWEAGKARITARPTGEVEIRRNRKVYRFSAGEKIAVKQV